MRRIQPTLFPETEDRLIEERDTSTFVNNMRLPVHRWFRFSAGFSAVWAEQVIREAAAQGPARLLDPFAGSGTTVLAAEDAGVASMGVEAHPFIHRVAQAKLLRHAPIEDYRQKARFVRQWADRHAVQSPKYPPLIEKCYAPTALAKLHALRMGLEQAGDDSAASELAWLTLVGILRVASNVGTAQWQYVLPKKEKKRSIDPFDAFDAMVRTVVRDMRYTQERDGNRTTQLLLGDARTCAGVPDKFATLVVTSPPYPNNYDYADATRLEMSFFREIEGWGDLQGTVRQHLVRSCSQHVPPQAIDLPLQLAGEELLPIRSAITNVCEQLAEVRLTKGGKKTYHLMVACYFSDLSLVWRALRRVCADGARVCFVVGDSAPYGVYVPVMDWLGELAVAAGFRGYTFEKTRDRNIKWKNRKHRVPLCEGRLWVEG